MADWSNAQQCSISWDWGFYEYAKKNYYIGGWQDG